MALVSNHSARYLCERSAWRGRHREHWGAAPDLVARGGLCPGVQRRRVLCEVARRVQVGRTLPDDIQPGRQVGRRGRPAAHDAERRQDRARPVAPDDEEDAGHLARVQVGRRRAGRPADELEPERAPALVVADGDVRDRGVRRRPAIRQGDAAQRLLPRQAERDGLVLVGDLARMAQHDDVDLGARVTSGAPTTTDRRVRTIGAWSCTSGHVVVDRSGAGRPSTRIRGVGAAIAARYGDSDGRECWRMAISGWSAPLSGLRPVPALRGDDDDDSGRTSTASRPSSPSSRSEPLPCDRPYDAMGACWSQYGEQYPLGRGSGRRFLH